MNTYYVLNCSSKHFTHTNALYLPLYERLTSVCHNPILLLWKLKHREIRGTYCRPWSLWWPRQASDWAVFASQPAWFLLTRLRLRAEARLPSWRWARRSFVAKVTHGLKYLTALICKVGSRFRTWSFFKFRSLSLASLKFDG